MAHRWIEIYGTDTCAPCNEIKKYLKHKSVHFEYYDVAMGENEARHEEARKLVGGSPQIPLVTNGNRAFVGTNWAELHKMIGEL